MIDLNEVEENEEDCHSQFRSKHFEEPIQIRFEKHKQILLRAFCLIVMSFLFCLHRFTAGVSYYALSYNMPNLNENPFLAILIGSSTDIPSFLLAFLYIPRYLHFNYLK